MSKIANFYKKYLYNCVAFSFLLAFILNLIIESLARHSVFLGIRFFTERPVVFLFNVFIIFTSVSIAILVKHRIFIYVLLSVVWLALGITNGTVLRNRMTPFTTKDLSVTGDGVSIITNYFTTTQIVLACVGVFVLILALVLTCIFAPKKKSKLNIKRNAAVFLLICLLMAGFANLAVKTGTIETFFGNLAYAYRDNGVPYCFITTWLNTGIRKPAGYSKEAVLSIFGEKEAGDARQVTFSYAEDKRNLPNIIMLQLESFLDPARISGITFSEDPISTFRSLASRYSSGFLTVPSIGAGTANTEFEVITGMSVKFFGPGEYPYKSILIEETCESIPYDLKNIGYSTHAIHNHRGAFYGRNRVFPNLGFETFTSLEYMNNAAKTPKNWAKDKILTGQITDALKATASKDYIYVISTQGHGKYPSEEILKSPRITVETENLAESRWAWEYYVNQLYEMDLFVKDLTETLSKYKEKTILVLYGDHLPALDITEEDLTDGTMYQTQYVIWSNFKTDKEDEDLFAYQLSAKLLDKLDIHVGTMVRFHQSNMESDDNKAYLSNLRILEYDMLYGQKYIYGGQNIIAPVRMQMGIKPILIEEIYQIQGKYYIKGQNFTEFSKVSLDGHILKTVYIGSTILALQQDIDPADIDRLKISQVEKNKEILSTTE